LRQTYHWLRNYFGCTGWYSWVTRLKLKLVSVCLETVLVLVQDRCTVCAKHSIGSKIVLDTPEVTRLNWKLISVHLEIVLILIQDRCSVCAVHTVSSEIILDTPDGTPM
jgi:hypothetical protein